MLVCHSSSLVIQTRNIIDKGEKNEKDYCVIYDIIVLIRIISL